MTPEEREERLAELKERRRRDRWRALLMPFFTLTIFLIAISFCMYLIKSCQERTGARPRLPIQREPVPPQPK
ncbi:MAG TPA: hypothetical protein VL754_05840 [Verrucomicrobiae bacterium]|jgi:hypothetical protein|nr:hypothetical protein [Verrucomicrobiae bacterium]